MANLLELNTLVNAYCPNVPSIVVSSALRECARDYFKLVQAHTVDINLNTIASNPLLELSVDAELEIVSIVSVKYSDYDELEPVSKFPTVEQSGKPNAFIAKDKRTIHLFPTPNDVHAVTVKVAVRPSRAATTIDDVVLDENSEALRFGTLARLKSQPLTDWHSPSEVQYYDTRYQEEVATRRIQLMQNESMADMRVEIPPFA